MHLLRVSYELVVSKKSVSVSPLCLSLSLSLSFSLSLSLSLSPSLPPSLSSYEIDTYAQPLWRPISWIQIAVASSVVRIMMLHQADVICDKRNKLTLTHIMDTDSGGNKLTLPLYHPDTTRMI